MLHLTQVKVHHRLFITFVEAAEKYRSGSGKTQIWKDSSIFNVDQTQMDVKNVSWLIWKEHTVLWGNIWAVTMFCRIEGKHCHPAYDFCHSYITLVTEEAKNVSESLYKIKSILCIYVWFLSFSQLYHM